MDKTPRVCISAGHGLGSRNSGQVDPGAGITRSHTNEAKFVLGVSRHLVADLAVLFAKSPGAYVMLRDAGYYAQADNDAAKAGCDLFMEIHTNSAGASATGVEVLYEDPGDRFFAADVSERLSGALKLRNRGAKRATAFAVLQPRYGMVQTIVELFFGSNVGDVNAWRARGEIAERAILNRILAHYGWRTVKSLPRTWNRLQRAAYRP